MASEQHRYKGIAVNGKIELEPGSTVPEGAEVTVLFQEERTSGNLERPKALKWLLATMHQGFDLKGGPYVNRKEFYGDAGRPN
jgi:hypothetical protein